jgi:hypothetical protein
MVGLQLKGRKYHQGKALMKKDMSLPAGAGLPSTHQPNLILSNLIFSSRKTLIPLADVQAADIALATDYEFGSVKSGFLRLFGRFNNVKAAERTAFDSWNPKSTKDTGAATRDWQFWEDCEYAAAG